MWSPRSPNPNHRRPSLLDLVRPAFVILHLVLLPVALLRGDSAGRRADEPEASEVRHERDGTESPRDHGRKA